MKEKGDAQDFYCTERNIYMQYICNIYAMDTKPDQQAQSCLNPWGNMQCLCLHALCESTQKIFKHSNEL